MVSYSLSIVVIVAAVAVVVVVTTTVVVVVVVVVVCLVGSSDCGVVGYDRIDYVDHRFPFVRGSNFVSARRFEPYYVCERRPVHWQTCYRLAVSRNPTDWSISQSQFEKAVNVPDRCRRAMLHYGAAALKYRQ